MIQALEEGKISRKEKVVVLVTLPWELDAQWYDYEDYGDDIHKQTSKIDKLIREFNERTGLLK